MPYADTLAWPPSGLDAGRPDAQLGEWLVGRHGCGGWGHVAIDGKVQRGSRPPL